jgi:Domain of unknown function (DUF4277)
MPLKPLPYREVKRRLEQQALRKLAKRVDKGIENLLGYGVKSDYINDDKIGRVMDELSKYGLNSLFIEIVSYIPLFGEWRNN